MQLIDQGRQVERHGSLRILLTQGCDEGGFVFSASHHMLIECRKPILDLGRQLIRILIF